MNLFESKSHDVQKEQEKFYQEFEAKVHDRVLHLELAEFRSDSGTYRELGIQSYRPSQWGLIVFCERGIYYYVSQQDSYMSLFTNGAGRTEEKLIAFSSLKELSYSLPEKKGFLSFLSPELSRTIVCSFKSSDGTKREFLLILNHNAQEIFQELSGR